MFQHRHNLQTTKYQRYTWIHVKTDMGERKHLGEAELRYNNPTSRRSGSLQFCGTFLKLSTEGARGPSRSMLATLPRSACAKGACAKRTARSPRIASSIGSAFGLRRQMQARQNVE